MYVRMLQEGKGPDGMTDFLKTRGVANAAAADSSQTTDPQTQKPVQEAQADKASETPAQGDKARNGTAL